MMNIYSLHVIWLIYNTYGSDNQCILDSFIVCRVCWTEYTHSGL